jgi:membrane protein
MSQNWTYDQNRHFDQGGDKPSPPSSSSTSPADQAGVHEAQTRPDDKPSRKGAAQPPRRGFHFSFRPKDIYALLKSTYQEWSKAKVPRMGAALAYYTIFSLAPLLVIAISIAGIAFGDKAVQGGIVNQIQGLIGADAARAVQTMIQSAHKPANQAIASIIGLVVLFLGASGVFNEMQDALNEIWGIDTTAKTGIWNMVKARFLSFGMVLGIGFLLLVSLLLSAALAAVAKYVSGFLPVPAAVLHLADILFSIFFITVLFAMIFKVLPDVKIPWSDVWVGAIVTAILFTIGKFLIGFYIGKSVTASAYGAAGSLVVIVAWIYYCAQLLYFGAEFTKVYATECGSQCAIAPQAAQARHVAPAHAHG